MTVLNFVALELDLSAFPQPANDDFANALVLSGTVTPPLVAPPALSGSTTEPGEPNHAARVDFGFRDEVTIGASVWYSWTGGRTRASYESGSDRRVQRWSMSATNATPCQPARVSARRS